MDEIWTTAAPESGAGVQRARSRQAGPQQAHRTKGRAKGPDGADAGPPFRIEFHWRAFAATMLAYIPAVIAGLVLFTLAGIARGIPWPPRWDDYTFAILVLGVVAPLCLAGGVLVRDFVVALRKVYGR